MFQFILSCFTFSKIDSKDNSPFFYSKERIFKFILTLIQFAGLFYIITYFQIESKSGILDNINIILLFFILNSISPFKYRPLILFLTSLVILLLSFSIALSGIFLFFGISLIICCHLKIKFWWRVFLIGCIAMVLVIFKAEIFYSERLTVMSSFLGALFMFRLILYLHEIKHDMIPKSMFQSISYFFLFPNLFFLFFPIVDYKTYIKTYYDKPEHEIWQKGIRWMLRGIVHIFAYRILCTYFLINPSEIKDLTSLLFYLLINYALILRISGIFHFIIGLLCMFGMNLPQTFDNYFLATNFLDLWRRINIYWREFVLKIFYYPIMFQLKKRLTSALLPTTLMIVFLITWILHSYQLFWITGVISIKWIDLIFWAIVGLFITITAVTIQIRHLKNKPPKIKAHTIPYYFITMFKIQGMVLAISILWMFWNSQSIKDWSYLISRFSVFSSSQIILIVSIFISITLVGVLIQILLNKPNIKKYLAIAPENTFWLTAPSIALLCLITIYKPQDYFSKTFKLALTNVSPNKNEKEAAEKSYYSGLMEGYDDEQGFGLGSKRIKKLLLKTTKNFYEPTNDLLTKRIKKNLKFDELGYLFSSNQFGMRDKSYQENKPNNTFRIVLLGGSYEMGSGVSDIDVFEKIVEDRINQDKIIGSNTKFEILNFAVGGYYLIQHVKLCEDKVFKFSPDAIIYFAHSSEKEHMIKDFAMIIKNRKDLEFPYLKSLKSKLKINSFMSEFEIRQKLIPFSDSLIYWSYKKMAEECSKNKCVPIWAYLLTTDDKFDENEFLLIKGYAEKLGYVTLDLSNPYKTQNIRDLQVSDLDAHPNAKGHQKIANCFYNQFLLKKDSILLKSTLINNPKTN